MILSNDIIEREIGRNKTLDINQLKVVAILSLNHRENLYLVFNWLTDFQLKQYSKFILNLPKNYKDFDPRNNALRE
ncbi:MAG: hypothetical protein O7C59_03930 [Rickettsia endosymbiont of Ixodes persulcatus]|nr:hypothetical protein [Rickettsia endosymbiont of Ixodes persulcatus]MCZ6903993.1 hypothetical protein [Rickettsia endosymbiont of Ixodes persulcatus]MCZ6908380.1 hypothetical protein [Rickettsia endosymbiont of Ixodes persulcatus]MCZ6911121.1 hypothetical protein [Rickettsia endosymbiont of Ixodes persulcatus]MCZ6913702.1 hypothetical protein [Rickettsia endosymbiont of Ixodes persulcatus]